MGVSGNHGSDGRTVQHHTGDQEGCSGKNREMKPHLPLGRSNKQGKTRKVHNESQCSACEEKCDVFKLNNSADVVFLVILNGSDILLMVTEKAGMCVGCAELPPAVRVLWQLWR